MIRRSITLDDSVNKRINEFRGKLLAESGLELDFTTTINFAAELGLNRMFNSSDPSKDKEIMELFVKYLSNTTLAAEARGDQLLDQVIKALPDIMKQMAKK